MFIKAAFPLIRSFTGRNKAPMFRRVFSLVGTEKARLSICALGIGYCWVNGNLVSKDLFTAPLSNYSKTVWYNTYDVTKLIRRGENVIAAWCGNGWYNEDFKSSWSFNEAAWRDVPKLWAQLEVNGEVCLETDEAWRVLADSAITFNDLRSGEIFDARLYDPKWMDLDYDDSEWQTAILDPTPPSGIMRECRCEPVWEFETYNANSVSKVGHAKWLYDFGQNISGYIRLNVSGQAGQTITIKYAEQINSDKTLQLNDMQKHYPESAFQTDRFICNGKHFEWSPRFTYHGFRYAEIDGIKSPDDISVEAVFVHQAVDRRSSFSCSDELLNKMFNAGIYSTWSNMFYQLTDCPTREKLGWTNDAQSSADQVLLDFKAERVLAKWLQDIHDAMREDGALPGIIPTAGWGYHWGNGPVSDGVLFEIPYQIYKHTGNSAPLIDSFPYFERYLSYLDERRDEDGFIRFGLPDWAKPGFNQEAANDHVPVEFINALLLCEFYKITALSIKLRNGVSDDYLQLMEEEKERVINRFLNPNGKCIIEHMTAVCMLIYYEAYADLEPLKKQLCEMLVAAHFQHDCGMVGMRRLLYALDKCGLQEMAYKVLTADNPHGYKNWFDNGATTLWETWNCERHEESKNHHMYSSFMTWLIETIAGIKQERTSVGYQNVIISPCFLNELTYAEAACDTVNGEVCVRWDRFGEKIKLVIQVPESMRVSFNSQPLKVGVNQFILN